MLTSLIILLVSFTFIQCNEETKKRPPEIKININGYWIVSTRQFKNEIPKNQPCPTPDAWFEPYALGTHFVIANDSISLFRYPFEYYGTFKYEIKDNFLLVKTNQTSTFEFLIHKVDERTIQFDFKEAVATKCILSANAEYVKFDPDPSILSKLKKDSVSYASLAGSWWHLRKEISYEDGTEPTILKFPNGMPDSLYITEEMLSANHTHPYVYMRLNGQGINLFLKHPNENGFNLEPEFTKDKILFSYFIDYDNKRDTVYYNIVFNKAN